MKKVMIPTCANPFEVDINGKKYIYPAGTEQEVPDEVAIVIENHKQLHYKKPEPFMSADERIDKALAAVENLKSICVGLSDETTKVLKNYSTVNNGIAKVVVDTAYVFDEETTIKNVKVGYKFGGAPKTFKAAFFVYDTVAGKVIAIYEEDFDVTVTDVVQLAFTGEFVIPAGCCLGAYTANGTYTSLLYTSGRNAKWCELKTIKLDEPLGALTELNGLSLYIEYDKVVGTEILKNDAIASKYNGKIWHCFGTSISNGSAEGKYPKYLAELSGMQYVNQSYSGGKMTQHILNKIKDDTKIANAEVITIEGFVNDWSQQSTLGVFNDTYNADAPTFCGALNEAITYIQANAPDATLIVITNHTGRNYNSIDLRRAAVRGGHTQNDFIKATIEVCQYRGIPCIDAGRTCGISEDTGDKYMADQIHHTELGGKQYANVIWAAMRNIPLREKA